MVLEISQMILCCELVVISGFENCLWTLWICPLNSCKTILHCLLTSSLNSCKTCGRSACLMHLCSYCKLVKLLCEASQSGSGEGENRRFQKKIFAECLSRRSRQRLCSLPSLTPPAHGKERTFCRASLLQHSAQSIHFTECWPRILGKEHNLCRVLLLGARQTSVTVSSTITVIFFAESRIRRSAKSLSSGR
jgi:hypothetical protein